MFGKVVRFDVDGHQAVAQMPNTSLAVARNGHSGLPAWQHQSNADLDWLQRLIDSQTAMLEFAQRERALTATELIRVAQVLCQEAWDSQSRSGQNAETWPPKMIADLIISNIGLTLRTTRLLQDPDLPEKYHQAANDLAQARVENDALRQRVRVAEDTMRESMAPVLRECFLKNRVSLGNDQIHPNLPDRPEV